MGQRVFKSEIQVAQTLPNEATLGAGFVAWLRSQFKWMFVRDQGTTSVGTAYTYGDGPIPEWALLGEYDNGSATGAGRSEYIWLPTPDGAIPIGMFRNGKLFAIHTDHLGTPRLMTNEANWASVPGSLPRPLMPCALSTALATAARINVRRMLRARLVPTASPASPSGAPSRQAC